ncbi:hypothetical protein K7X08_021631 [Anisodus acutangulus]|uniref:Uncharacterized protein n=1 Tax=Anisodus acutangulus TaxID=402998 RepID=A0A9Q1M4R5_9SOLA|nr:hypothetical protein K7X08_021631 [Anisodus acutangulus]
MWGALCEWVRRFSVDSSDNFSKLKEGVNLILKKLKDVNVINTSALEDSVKAFFWTYAAYNAMISSSSQEMTKECHQKSLCDVQQCLIEAKEESTNVTEHMEDLQAKLVIIEKELRILSAKSFAWL